MNVRVSFLTLQGFRRLCKQEMAYDLSEPKSSSYFAPQSNITFFVLFFFHTVNQMCRIFCTMTCVWLARLRSLLNRMLTGLLQQTFISVMARKRNSILL